MLAPERATILLVEDDESIRELMSYVLTRAGFRVLPASGPSEATEVAALRGASIDLLLTDVAMPEMSGYELAEKFTQAHPGAAVLFITAHVDRLAGSQHPVILKPFDLEELVSTISKMLSRSQSAPAEDPAA